MCSTIKKNQRNFAVCDELAPASIRNLRQICMWLRVALIYRSGKGKTVRVSLCVCVSVCPCVYVWVMCVCFVVGYNFENEVFTT